MRSTADKLKSAVALQQNGHLQQAGLLYLEVLEVEPENFDANHLLGVVASQTGDLQAAYDLIEHALAIDPGAALAHFNFGVVLQALKRPEEAVHSYQEAFRLAPSLARALAHLGGALQNMGRFEESIGYCERALEIDPHDFSALNNLGYALISLKRHEEGLLCIESALAVQPDSVVTLFNQGNALQYLNRLDQALASYRRALELDPNNADVNFSEGVCRLLLGDFVRGWPKYQWRWKKEGQTRQSFGQAQWTGEQAIAGKTLLLYAEQGYGDTICFARYARVLKDMGAKVILRVPPALTLLLAGLDGADQVSEDGQPLPAFDYQCSLMDVPGVVGTTLATIPSPAPYLACAPERAAAWAPRLRTHAGPRVGLVWAGNPKHENDKLRSVSLIDFIGLVSERCQFVSLQKNLSPLERIILQRHPEVQLYGDDMNDFADTAALIANLDLVITVDTSVAHLAGAMGKPVWILLPFAPDWRWMLEREYSPWYLSALLFRQPSIGDWRTVLAKVSTRLAQFIDDRS
jgi:tetratricopeptide (TPR) repeat protein